MENPHAGTVSNEQLLAGFREQLRLETKELIPVEPIMSMENDSEKMVCLLPPVFRRLRDGYVFTGVCLSTGGTPVSGPRPLTGEGGDTPLFRTIAGRMCGAGGMPLAFMQKGFLLCVAKDPRDFCQIVGQIPI